MREANRIASTNALAFMNNECARLIPRIAPEVVFNSEGLPIVTVYFQNVGRTGGAVKFGVNTMYIGREWPGSTPEVFLFYKDMKRSINEWLQSGEEYAFHAFLLSQTKNHVEGWHRIKITLTFDDVFERERESTIEFDIDTASGAIQLI